MLTKVNASRWNGLPTWLERFPAKFSSRKRSCSLLDISAAFGKHRVKYHFPPKTLETKQRKQFFPSKTKCILSFMLHWLTQNLLFAFRFPGGKPWIHFEPKLTKILFCAIFQFPFVRLLLCKGIHQITTMKWDFYMSW